MALDPEFQAMLDSVPAAQPGKRAPAQLVASNAPSTPAQANAGGLDPEFAAMLRDAAAVDRPSDPDAAAAKTPEPSWPSAIGSAFVRPIARAITAAPGMAADSFVAAGNILSGAVPLRNPDGSINWTGKNWNGGMELPSSAFDRALNSVTSSPSGIGKAAEFLSTALLSSRLPMLPTSAPAATPSMAQPLKAAVGVDPAIASGAQLGLKFTPEQAGAGIGWRALQSLTGSAKLERSLSKSNASAVDAAVSRQIGLPAGVAATPEALAAAKSPANAVYAEAARTGDVDLSALDPTLRPFIAEARQQLRLPASDLKSLDANDLVTTVRQLRAQGFANQAAPRYMPSQKLLGSNQIAAAKALDNALDAHVQQLAAAQPGNTALASLMPRLMEARQSLATIASAQRALRPGGHYFAGSLYRQLNSGAPLQGDMRTIAQAYGLADRSLQDVNRLRDAGPFSVLDLLAGGAGLEMAHSLGSPWLLGAFAARPLARAAMGAQPFQRAVIAKSGPLMPALPPPVRRAVLGGLLASGQ